jgi:hypothetical protein
MNSTDRLVDAHGLGGFPALAGLRLDSDDIAAIVEQGFISPDRRGDRTYYKLRFRRHGRQRVCYIGGASRAMAVEAELKVLQRQLQIRRHLAVLTRSVTDALRAARENLQPLVKMKGYYFHGHAPRKHRNNTN